MRQRAPGKPGAPCERPRVAAGARRGAGAERPSGVHAGNEQPDPVPYGFDGYVRNGVDLSRGGADGVWRVQRSGELALSPRQDAMHAKKTSHFFFAILAPLRENCFFSSSYGRRSDRVPSILSARTMNLVGAGPTK